jgi:hypothetical protein
MDELNKLQEIEVDMRARWIQDENGWRKLNPRAWPPNQPKAEAIPELRKRVAECEGVWMPAADCEQTKFDLASALVFTGERPDEGVGIYKAMAEKGNMDGMVATAVTLIEGLGVDVDEKKGFEWLEKATQAGNAQAQYEMGVCYYNGDPIPEDESKAFAYFKLAAEQHHQAGMFMYGDCLLDGIGCEKDVAKSIPWIYAAAEMGHRAARSRILAFLNSAGTFTAEGKFTDTSRLSIRKEHQAEEIDLKILPQGERRVPAPQPAPSPLTSDTIPAFAVYTRLGERVGFHTMIADCAANADVVLVGEFHDDPVAHHVELQILRQLADKHRHSTAVGKGAAAASGGGVEVVLSMEMFETDVQPVMDEFLDGQIRRQGEWAPSAVIDVGLYTLCSN